MKRSLLLIIASLLLSVVPAQNQRAQNQQPVPAQERRETAQTKPTSQKGRVLEPAQKVGVPSGCQPTRARAEQLLKELNAKVSTAERARAKGVVEKSVQRGRSAADGYDQFTAGAFLRKQFLTAAWGALTAASMEWKARYVSNAGVSFVYLNRLDEAEPFLLCAQEMAPRSGFVIEALAMLAHKRKDCAKATRQIEQAVGLLPGDMNVHYTAGIIYFKCGDRARAKQHLLLAQEQKPDDQTVEKALKVVDPAGQTARRPPPKDELRKLVEECFRFMDGLLARAELPSRLANAITQAESPGAQSQDIARDLRRHIERAKSEINNNESRARDARGRPEPVNWNQTIFLCAAAYAQALYEYHLVVYASAELSVMAAAMGADPFGLAQRLGVEPGRGTGDYFIQDAREKYFDALKPVDAALEAAVASCGADPACPARQVRAIFCPQAVPLWQEYRATVSANMTSAEGGFARATEIYAVYWLSLAVQAKLYMRRSVAALKPDSMGLHLKYVGGIKQVYGIHVGGTIRIVSDFLLETRVRLDEDLDAAPQHVTAAAAGAPRGPFTLCEQQGLGALTVEDALKKVIAALNEASSYEATFSPECELEIGGYTVTVTLGEGGLPNLETNFWDGPLSAAGETDFDRWGVTVEASESDIWGVPVGVATVGVATEVGVSLWGEGTIGGSTDFGVEGYTKIGLGAQDKAGVIRGSCYVINVSGRVNARVFAEALVR